ncbi:centrosomal protein kizuna [Bombina bombina]|uniref:centrosomal protein kizuna n=1 Tax=Bombina bombina TaxID=8345 RepID=UPI00235A545A|nr:centrosomal protein kizuna [Bombina bombina]
MTETKGEFHTMPEYEDRVSNLQRSLRDCERKRLELERKLFECSSSDSYICHLKHTKLQLSLKEACEREKRARLRNQAIIQEFDRIEAQFHTLIAGVSKMQQKKMLQVSRQVEINSGANMSRRMYHPATIFMGRQMSANSSIEHCLTQRKSLQPSKSFSISDPHSVRQAAINSNVTDSCVVLANSDIQCLNKPDIIDAETSFQISQKMLVTSTTSSENGGTHGIEIDKTQSASKHFVESKQSAQLSTQTLQRLSPEYRAGDLQNDSSGSKVEDALMYESLLPNEERFKHANPSRSSPDACDYINKQTSDKHSACENLSGKEAHDYTTDSEEEDHDLDTSSSLTVSISDSEDISSAELLEIIDGKDSVPQDKTQLKAQKVQAVLTASEGTPDTPFHVTPVPDSGDGPSSVSAISPYSLSDKGFFYLLDSIEDMVLKIQPDHSKLYRNTVISQAKLNQLISLSNQMEALKQEDLESCISLVLHQLHRLLKGTMTERSSPEEHLIDNKSHTAEKTQSPISELLKERLLSHISFLKKHQLLNEELIPSSFSTFFMLDEKMKACQVLTNSLEDKTDCSPSSLDVQSSLLTKRSPGDRLSSSSSSRNSKSVTQDVTNSCEDDKQEKDFIGKNYVPEKAEVLLQNDKGRIRDSLSPEQDCSATNCNDEEEISDVSELEIPGLTNDHNILRKHPINKLSSEASLPSSEKTPMFRKENKITLPISKKSKAFWGESDDSSSDIEAILRPQNHIVDGDDFDDFFD